MKFTENAFKYYFKNFLMLLLTFTPATIFFVTLINASGKVQFVANLSDASVKDFVDVLNVFYPHGWLSALYLVLFAVLFALTLAVFTAISEYNMRTGSLNLKESFRQVPGYILPCLVVSAILLVVSVLINLFLAMVIYLTYKVCIADKIININGVFLSDVFHVLFSLIYALISAFLLYSANHIMINKTTFRESLSLTVLNFDKKFWGYIGAFILPVIVLVPLYLFTPTAWWGVFIYGVAFVLIFMYIASLNITSFYTLNNIERKDLKKYPYSYFK